jgi:hypothetical protein
MNKRLSGLMLAVALLTVMTMTTVPAFAQMGQSVLSPVRCGTKLIEVGKDTKESILAKCGEPYYRYPGRRGGGEVWAYNRGSGRFSGVLKFTGNMLTSIEKNGYGFSAPPSR